MSSYGVTNVTVEIGYASPPPPSPSPPPPGAAATLTIAATAWALGASPVTDATTGVTRVDYISAASLTDTWRTNRPEDISVTATFSAAVTGFTSSSVSVPNGAVYNFTAARYGKWTGGESAARDAQGGRGLRPPQALPLAKPPFPSLPPPPSFSSSDGATYTFGVRPASTGSAATLAISVAAGMATTEKGGLNLAASLTLYYDPTPPVPVIRTNATKGATSELYIAFAVDYGEVRALKMRRKRAISRKSLYRDQRSEAVYCATLTVRIPVTVRILPRCIQGLAETNGLKLYSVSGKTNATDQVRRHSFQRALI